METFHYFLTHRLLAEIMLAGVGIAVAWKLWRFLGLKALCIFFIARTAFMVVGAALYEDALSPDLPGWYLHASWILAGFCPGIDFMSPYFLGFNGLIAAAVRLYHSPLSIQVLFACIEFVGVCVAYRFLKEIVCKCVAKRVIILFVSSPLCYLTACGAQDEVILFAGVFAVLYSTLRDKNHSSGMLTFITVVTTKITAVFYCALIALLGRGRTILIAIGGFASYFIISSLCGVKVVDLRFGRTLGMDVASDAVAKLKTPGNIWYYLPPLPEWFPIVVGLCVVAFVILISVSSIVSTTLGKKERARFAAYATFLVVACMYLFVPGCLPYYVFPVLPILYLAVFEGSQKSVIIMLKCILAISWCWSLYYCGDSQPWMRSWLKKWFCLYYLGQYVLVIAWITHAVKGYFTSPIKGLVEAYNVLRWRVS